jgi:hypothetical protein
VPGTPPLSIVAWWALDADAIEKHTNSCGRSSNVTTTPATTAVQTPAPASRDTSTSSNGAISAVDTGARTDPNGSQQHDVRQQQLQPAITADSSSEIVSSSDTCSKSTSAAAATSSVFVSMLQRYAEIPGAGYCGLERALFAVSTTQTIDVADPTNAQQCC